MIKALKLGPPAWVSKALDRYISSQVMELFFSPTSTSRNVFEAGRGAWSIQQLAQTKASQIALV